MLTNMENHISKNGQYHDVTKGSISIFLLGRVKIFEYFVHNPDLKELNKLRTRILFFLKLDNGKSGLSPRENSKN